VVTGGGNGPYYMIRSRDSATISNHCLLAILNHPLSEAFVRTNTSPFRGGYYSHGKQFIEDLPIPVPADTECSAIDALVMQMIGAIDTAAVARTPHQKNLHERQAAELKIQIEALVTNLFGLSTADMDVVRAVPVPD